MPALKGNFAGLADLAKRVRDLKSPAFSAAVARQVGGTVLKLVADGFRQSRDPYGAPWAPVSRNRARDVRARARRARAGKPPRADRPLIDTGRLRAAATSPAANTTEGSTVRISIPVAYASYHQEGTRRMVARPMVPDQSRGLGPIWLPPIRKTVDRAIAEQMKPGSR